jgi:2',3'-cyclic-nucleotide 2'-phosphodiesterase (5'-nucleotidase family)
MKRRLFLATIAALLCTLSPLAHAQDASLSLDLTILHDNDLHGHMLPFAYTEVGRGKVEQASVGGAARRATLIRELKKHAKNPVMVIDSGDTTTRGPLTNAYEGIADIEVMNAVGYDLGCLGNNEFKLKDGIEATDAAGAQAALLQFLRRSRFPWVCANAGVDANCLLPGVAPFVVREIQGVRVGFLGLTAPRSASYPQTKGWWFGDPVTVAQKWIPIARKECDVLIAVTHIGVDLDKKLAAETTGLDAIVGGDSHTFLYKAEVVNGVPIVQTGEFGVNLGKFDLHFEKNGNGGWKLGSYQYVLMPITSKLKEADDVKRVAERYAGPLQATIVGNIPSALIGKTPEERTILTAQVTVNALQKGSGADIALTNPGDGMFEFYRKPQLSLYDLRAAWPFKNNVSTVRLMGAEVLALKAKFPKTVQSQNLTALDNNTLYTVAFIDFVATDTYGIAPNRLTDTGRDMREVIMDGLK